MRKPIIITKASGETEAFNVKKLEYSLRKAGASESVVSMISQHISEWIVPGISTHDIFSHAFSLLKKTESGTHIRYRLKKSFLELGPSGYPFEKIMGELFRRQGYRCETGVVLQGRCISHEMDVVATKNQTQLLVECKYRQEQGKQVSIQTPLYVYSRINDIIDHQKTLEEYRNYHFQGWVITNTRFSADSGNYGKCKGLKMMGWDYPSGNGLKEMVEKYHLYPLSILTHISTENIQKCFNEGIVTCTQLYDNQKFIPSLEISPAEQNLLLLELEGLLK